MTLKGQLCYSIVMDNNIKFEEIFVKKTVMEKTTTINIGSKTIKKRGGNTDVSEENTH